jgi:uncharacterized glyoxalase superfamily protein PhnB
MFVKDLTQSRLWGIAWLVNCRWPSDARDAMLAALCARQKKMRRIRRVSMIQNRSVPPGAVIPFLHYDDVPHAIEWLHGAFGFTERLRTPPDPDGSIHLAQLNVSQGAVMLRTLQAGDNRDRPANSILVRVEDVDAHCERAREFGARVVREPKTAEFGERQCTIEDLAGNQWTFSQSVADVDPREWGALVKEVE